MDTRTKLDAIKKQIKALQKLSDEAEANLHAANQQLLEIQHDCHHDEAVVVVTPMLMANTRVKHTHCKACDHIVLFWPFDFGYENPVKYLQESDYP